MVQVSDVMSLSKSIRFVGDMWGILETQGLFMTEKTGLGCQFTNIFDNPSLPLVVRTEILLLD